MTIGRAAADSGAVVTAAMATVSWLNDIELYLRIGAAGVAICAGICAGLYHYEAWRQKRRERKLNEFDSSAAEGRRNSNLGSAGGG